MSTEEVFAILNAKQQQQKEEWEKVRQINYYSVAPHTDKVKKPEDLYKFPWELPKKQEGKKWSKRRFKENSKKAIKWLESNSQ